MPTLSMSCLEDVSGAFKPPRTVLLDFPIGCPGGKPSDPDLSLSVLRAALEAAPAFGPPWAMRLLPHQWSNDGDRSWEEELKDIYRHGIETVAAHVGEHASHGESLVGGEKDFTIRCNC